MLIKSFTFATSSLNKWGFVLPGRLIREDVPSLFYGTAPILCLNKSCSGTLWFSIKSVTWAWSVSKTALSVEINADSWRLPRVRFCEVMTETVLPDSACTSSIFEWLSVRNVRWITCVMNDQSFSVLFVALWSRTKLNSDTLPLFSMN